MTTKNVKYKIYNIDLPDVIEIRNKLIPPKSRVENIGIDFKDTTWFSRIDNFNGSVFFASGVFYYLREDDVHNLVNKMAEYFKGGKLVIDTCNKIGLKIMPKTVVKSAKIKNVDGYFHVNTMDKDVTPWLKNAKASKKGYMLGYHDLKEHCIPCLYRMLSKFGDNNTNMKILRFDFYK